MAQLAPAMAGAGAAALAGGAAAAFVAAFVADCAGAAAAFDAGGCASLSKLSEPSGSSHVTTLTPVSVSESE